MDDGGGFPGRRLRRNRYHDGIRRMVRETRLGPDDLIQPLFVKAGLSEPRPIPSMPGQHQHTLDSLCEAARDCEEAGLPAVILFGVPAEKDATGTPASDEDGIVQRALRRLNDVVEDLLLIADVCLCEYTDHGHCGVVEDGRVVNDPSLERLARTAVSQVRAGADMVAPSDMMDGRVGAIRSGLDDAGFPEIPIMSYAVKYHSSFYGPFRDAAESSPEFGDRRTYQMDPPNRREAREEARLDLQEGTDWLMVKPALPYLDVVRELRDRFDVPLAAYSVSGEFAMIESAAEQGRLNRKDAVLEALTGVKRAGADAILTYWAREAAGWLAP